MQGPTRLRFGEAEDDGNVRANKFPSDLPGVVATACRQRGTRRNTGSPSGDRRMDQLAARERKAGLTGMAERLVVPMKPGNSGGGRGSQLQGGRKKRRRKGRLAISLAAPEVVFRSCRRRHMQCYGDCVSLLREPDAANPHVRFDERGVGNGSMVRLVRHRQTKGSATDRPSLNHRATPRLYTTSY